MTDSEFIRRAEAQLEAWKAGDSSAAARLYALFGGDQISVGNISGSTAVAIGNDIRITVRHHDLPPELVTRLLSLADALDVRAVEGLTQEGKVTIFLSSPGDVVDERARAIKAIERLQTDPLYKQRVTVELVAWDKPGDRMPLLASITPQEAIDRGMRRPSECDIVVVILWSRFGTPLPLDKYRKSDGSQYLSGTEWEFEDAVAAAEATGRPYVLVYRRIQVPTIDLDDLDAAADKLEQRRRVNAFFAAFSNPDGSSRRGYNPYVGPTEFENALELDLKKLIIELLEDKRTKSLRLPDNREGPKSIAPIAWPSGVSPFPGLRAFGPADATVYFGRGRETDGLLKELSHPDCRFLAVVGASGSGKSSLVGAGLIPRLAEGAIEGSADWPVVRFTPDEWGEGDPFSSLAGALVASPLHVDKRGLVNRLREESVALREILETHLQALPTWAEVLLVVDQFEEMFTRVRDDNLRKAFIDLLSESAATERARVVITIRADYFDRFAELPALAALLKRDNNATFPLSTPEPIDLYEMIAGPARIAGLRFEDGLARQVLADTGTTPGALALMAYALQLLYEESATAEGILTWEAYREFGGVRGAIGRQAHKAFTRLDEEARDALSTVFRELVEVDESGTATRKRTALKLVARDEPSARLVDAFTEARLLVTSGDRFPLVEVAHEALFHSWPRLSRWIEEVQDDLILRRQVRTAAELWELNDRDKDFLWPDGRLQLAYGMCERLAPELSEVERDFLRPEWERLVEELHNPTTEHSRRAWIGDRLAAIGDRRPGVGLRPDGLPDIAWCGVSGRSALSEEAEGSPRELTPFRISKYLTTYIQFEAFVNADDGYFDARWWADYMHEESGRQNHTIDNYPADAVSWYDAMAFCRWLTARYRQKGLISSESTIRLPTEWEWQQAATNGNPRNIYPWGTEWDSTRANTHESGLNRTTAVGMYPNGGVSRLGALDMIGNVKEWCLDEFADLVTCTPSQCRAVRGGSWFDIGEEIQISYREGAQMMDRLITTGFRVVCIAEFP